jgi:hypothetical protein
LGSGCWQLGVKVMRHWFHRSLGDLSVSRDFGCSSTTVDFS